ncbi:MAG: class I SAM-dependent methyltransferase [Anaerolineaceae bacterium]|jgi:SAM-dependent methyltransferase
MTLYNHFAQVYARGYYPEFSQALANLMPGIFSQFEIPSSGKLVDLACGEGSFALEMARKGWDVTGIDQSEEMLRLARNRAATLDAMIEFSQQDMREFSVPVPADLVTCWFDSLNYLLRIEDVQSAFGRVYQALKPGGWFIFDMNTIYGLAVEWQKQKCYVQQETEDLLELHQTNYDYDKRMATMRITWFIRNENNWQKYEEIHFERAYSVDKIKNALIAAGFSFEASYGSLKSMSPVKQDSTRAWIFAQKKA